MTTLSLPLYKKNEHDSLMYLWRQRTLYVGPPHYSRYRKYNCDCLLIGFESALAIKKKGSTQLINSHIVLIPAGVSFHMGMEGKNFGLLFMDYLSLDLKKTKAFAQSEHEGIFYNFETDIEQSLIEAIRNIYQTATYIECVETDIFELLKFDRTLDNYNVTTFPEDPDPRLGQIINMYLNGDIDLNAPIAVAAKSVELSVSRVNQLFREHLKINFRIFRNRLRIHRFFLASAFGRSNTQAALEAGFVDQAHFCRRFKESAGIKISVYNTKSVKCTIIVEREMAERYQRNLPIFGLPQTKESD